MILELFGFVDPSILAAAAFWNDTVIGYKDNSDRSIAVQIFQGNLPTGSLGQTKINLTTKTDNFYYVERATITIDVKYWERASEHSKIALMRHELAHALGFGGLWKLNNLVTDGKYISENTIETYNLEFNQDADYINIDELNAHWKESNRYIETGIKDSWGRDLRDEICTTYINSAKEFVSLTTLSSLEDLNFIVKYPSETEISISKTNTHPYFKIDNPNWNGSPILEKSDDLINWYSHNDNFQHSYFRLKYIK